MRDWTLPSDSMCFVLKLWSCCPECWIKYKRKIRENTGTTARTEHGLPYYQALRRPACWTLHHRSDGTECPSNTGLVAHLSLLHHSIPPLRRTLTNEMWIFPSVFSFLIYQEALKRRKKTRKKSFSTLFDSFPWKYNIQVHKRRKLIIQGGAQLYVQ